MIASLKFSLRPWAVSVVSPSDESARFVVPHSSKMFTRLAEAIRLSIDFICWL
jgi:hypothetical protein